MKPTPSRTPRRDRGSSAPQPAPDTRKPGRAKVVSLLPTFDTDAGPAQCVPVIKAADAGRGCLETITTVEARIDVGFGNAVFIRGQGQGLSWQKGLPLSSVDPATWKWSTREAKQRIVFKLLLNDQLWCQGDDLVVEAGGTIQLTPSFQGQG